ncbi:MAG: HEAT repeat domain-containing protein [Ignavibacteriales bacterium]|nr:HEAT repeat domain-containing protein [Ignavibacteriales bacterium]
MSFQIFLILALAATATFLVIVISIGLVVHKALHSKTIQRQQKLYTEYSQQVAEIILQDLPTLPEDSTASGRFDQYEILLAPLKDQLEKMTKGRRSLHRKAVKLALIDFARDVAGETSDRLVYFSYSLGLVDDEIKLLQSKNWWDRAQAAHDLGVLRARRAVTPLAKGLEDEHPDVRIQAMQSLVILGGVHSLETILMKSKNLSRWTAIELSIIVMRFKEEAVPFLIDSLQSTDQSIVLFCIEMLAEIGFVSAVEPLRTMARDYPNTVIRAKAIEALGRLGDERAEAMLLELLRNPLPTLRFKAIEAVGRIGIRSALSALETRLKDGVLQEKILAARSIAAAGPDGISLLTSLKNAENEILRGVAQQVLEESRVEPSVA